MIPVLKNPRIDPQNMFLNLLKILLVQDSTQSFRLKLETPSRGSSRPFLKESMGRGQDKDFFFIYLFIYFFFHIYGHKFFC